MRKLLSEIPWRTVTPNAIAGLTLTLIALLVSHLTIPIGKWGSMTLPGDAAVFSYILSWGSYALFHCPWRYYDIPLFFPAHNMLPGTDGLELPALLVSPVWYISKNPVLTYNFATFLSHVFCLLSAYYAVRVVLRIHRAWCVLLAVFFAITSDRFWHAFGHLNLLWSGILPMIFAQAWAGLEHGRRRDYIALAIAMGAAVYFSVYLFVLGAMSATAAVVLWIVSRLKIPSKSMLISLVLSGVLALVIAAPKVLVYKSASSRSTQARSSLLQASYYSASVEGYTQPTFRPQRLKSFWYKVLPEPKDYRQTDEDQQFLGYFFGLMLLAEFVRLLCRAFTGRFDKWDRLSAAALLACLAVVLCSFGPQFRVPLGAKKSLSPYVVLHKLFLQFTGFYRVPARLAFVAEWLAILPVGVLLLRTAALSRLQRWAYTATGLGLILFEHAPAERPFQTQWDRLTIFDRMDQLDPSRDQPYVAMDPDLSITWSSLSNTAHWRPAVNGWLGSPLGKRFDQLAGEMKFFPNTSTLRWLAENQVQWILVIDPAQKAKVEADNRLKFVDSAQGISLYTLADPGGIVREWKNETEAWNAVVARERAALPGTIAWPDGNLLKPAGGDSLRQTPEGSLVIQSTELKFATILFDPVKPMAPAVWRDIEIRYRLTKPTDHAVKLYWKTEAAAMSEERSVEGSVTQPADGSGIWTAHIRPEENPLWLRDKNLVRMRFDFHSFANLQPAEVEVLSVKLSSQKDVGTDATGPWR